MNVNSLHIDVTNLNVLLTGGSNGIGLQISKAFLLKGASVVNWDLKETEQVKKLKEEFGNRYQYEYVDISNETSIQQSHKRLPEQVNVLINNAGLILKSPLTDIETSDWDKIYDVNVKGTMLVTKYVIPKIKGTSRGRIINLSSMTAKIGLETYSLYSSTKAAVSNLTKVWSLELSKYEITVNAICPGWVDTQMKGKLIEAISNLHDLNEEDALSAILSFVPQHRYIQTEEIAFACLFLSSGLSQGISGQELFIDNGLTNTFKPGFHMK
ncbi:SDR family NAD(P)-dependent oxidoreductase [Virgibacillus byunsanensis]|uniref:SDR family NAD(P)-dependent oxidoreductase n=1 Tax=Virgibacillus byunsanensis TaxID=570945 RepID=A0ABW3LIA2_9BACI